ncbi:MAG: hypothetical protein LBD11_07260 [Candidatus Peribacteria bacterium]|jgi:hypothetical protein|nr:hypothetical protein [Candidatus Peribacteria bacterium]
MPTRVARIIIIAVGLVLVLFLKKYIKRLIFIVVLLGLAFFIYGLFSPSGASRLRYGVKTFPQRVASFFGGEVVLPYTDLPTIDLPSVEGSSSELSSEDTTSTDLPSLLPQTSDSSDSRESPETPTLTSSKEFTPSQKRSSGVATLFAKIHEKIEADQTSSSDIKEKPEDTTLPGISEVIQTPAEPEIPEKTPTAPAPIPPKKTTTTSTPSGLSSQDYRDAEKLWGMLLD